MKCLFCEFASGKRKSHISGHPFEPLNETKNTLSFMAIDIPAKEDGHLLVIPKKHFTYIEDLPKSILHELIEHASLISKALKKTHDGCNILLNDGRSAGQNIMHTHFHIIPRNRGDKIKIEVWKRKRMSKRDFVKLNGKIRNVLMGNKIG